MHLTSPLDLGHFMVHLLPLPLSPFHVPQETLLLACLTSTNWKFIETFIQIQKPSLCSGNKVVSHLFLNPLFNLLERSLTLVLRPLKLSQVRVRHQSRISQWHDTHFNPPQCFSAWSPTRMGLECSPFLSHL